MESKDSICYSVEEAAKVLRLSRSYLYKLAARREIPVVKLGTRVLIPKAALEMWIRDKTIGGGKNGNR